MASIILADGSRENIDGLLKPELFRDIEASKQSPIAYLNNQFDTGEGPTAVAQIADQLGFIAGSNQEFGVRSSTIEAILKPTKVEAGAITRDADLAPRVFFPIYVLGVLETTLRDNHSSTVAGYNDMIAVRDSIPTDSFERPLIDFGAVEAQNSQPIAQLSEPTAMVRATLSNKIIKVPSYSIGIEYSDQAARALSLELLMRGVARQAEAEAVRRIQASVLAFYNGDADLGMASLATEGRVATAASFDSDIVAAGELTQKAWVKFLYGNGRALKRTITHVITDIDGALAIENRKGRPTVQGDNPTSKRIDTLESVINPMWPDQVKVFISTDPSWPANTIVGLDSNYAIHHVDSTLLNYSGAEEYAIRRSTKLRFDTGSVAYRLFNDAWDAMTLTV